MADPDPADCCRPSVDPRVARRFDEIYAGWAEDTALPEMVGVSARLLDVLRDASLARPSVLEIGCGTGAVSVALLEMGATSVRGVDLSAESVAVARRRAAEAGVGERASFAVGHGAAVRGERHDWVILDRVLCCDGRPAALLDAVVGAGSRRIALTVPESRGWRGLVNRPMWAAEALWDLVRGGCRGYVHDLRRVERQLGTAGFRSVRTEHVGLWVIGVYER